MTQEEITTTAQAAPPEAAAVEPAVEATTPKVPKKRAAKSVLLCDESVEAVADALTHKLILLCKDILTLEEAAAYTGMTKSFLYKMTSQRSIPHSKPNGKVCFFRRADLDEWMMSCPVATSAELNAEAIGRCMKSRRYYPLKGR